MRARHSGANLCHAIRSLSSTRACCLHHRPYSRLRPASMAAPVKYLSAKEAAEIDKQLMSDTHGFTLDQLTELAGLSCACAICHWYPPSTCPTVTVVCGPGNNGCDGLVAARHLRHFGYTTITIIYPSDPKTSLYQRLLIQNEKLGAKIVKNEKETDFSECDLIVDAVFGFSFDPTNGIKPPYDTILTAMTRSSKPVVSIDVPSGWHVEDGDIAGTGLNPDALVSLTAPKKCAKHFTGRHHAIGGRFVPPSLAERFQLHLPSYPESQQFVLIDRESDSDKQRA